MCIIYLGSFRIKMSRNIHEVRKLVKEVLEFLSLFGKVLGVKIQWNLVVRCLIHTRVDLYSKRLGTNPQRRTKGSLRRTLAYWQKVVKWTMSTNDAH